MDILVPLLFVTHLASGSVHDVTLQPGASHDYEVQLGRGESAQIVVRQQGVDVVVEVRAPDGKLIDAVDGPTGRNGDERVEIIALVGGRYSLRVRPFDANEPAGKYRLEVQALRSARETAKLLRTRADARKDAAEWLRARSGTIDPLAARARVIGLGEATHGSREFGDLRVSLTKTSSNDTASASSQSRRARVGSRSLRRT
jgi:hypothetical protein